MKRGRLKKPRGMARGDKHWGGGVGELTMGHGQAEMAVQVRRRIWRQLISKME